MIRRFNDLLFNLYVANCLYKQKQFQSTNDIEFDDFLNEIIRKPIRRIYRIKKPLKFREEIRVIISELFIKVTSQMENIRKKVMDDKNQNRFKIINYLTTSLY